MYRLREFALVRRSSRRQHAIFVHSQCKWYVILFGQYPEPKLCELLCRFSYPNRCGLSITVFSQVIPILKFQSSGELYICCPVQGLHLVLVLHNRDSKAFLSLKFKLCCHITWLQYKYVLDQWSIFSIVFGHSGPNRTDTCSISRV